MVSTSWLQARLEDLLGTNQPSMRCYLVRILALPQHSRHPEGPLRTNLLVAVLTLSLSAAQTQIPNGMTLPEGMTEEQARALAKENGITPRQPVSSSPSKGKIPSTIHSSVDTIESRLSRDDTSAVGYKEGLATTNSDLRWGQTIFRAGDPGQAESYSGAVGPGYALGPGDEIVLTLWGEKEARYQVELDRDGQAVIELVGAISLNGQTLRSAEELLRNRLTKVYAGLADGKTQMDVTMGKLKRVRVIVTGDAVHPGSFFLSGNTTVLTALFQSGGPNDLGSEREIEIRRDGQTRIVDLYDYFARGKRPSRDILQDGDLVRIPRKGKVVAIKGDIGRPGLYELLSKEGAKEILEYAGGVNATTATAPIMVQRLFENGRRDAVLLPSPSEILKGASAALEDGDSIWVFRGGDPSNATVEISGDVRFPGRYPMTPGLTVGEIVEKAGGLTKYAYAWRALITRENPDSTMAILRHDLTQGGGPVLQARDRIEIKNRVKMGFSDSVTISGAVHIPGRYAWETGMTVKDLILKAGGFLKRAEFGTLRLETPMTDREETKVEILSVDSSLVAGGSDHIIDAAAHLAVPFDPKVNELEFVEVKGWVLRPGKYSISRLDERLSEILARAGGLRSEGYLEGAKLLRAEANGDRIQVHFAEAIAKPGGKADIPMRAGDTIAVPKKPATVQVHGRVNTPGHVVWQEGKKWSWYVQQAGGLADSAYEDGIYVQYADGTVQTSSGGIRDSPNPGSVVNVPFRKPAEPTTFKDTLSGINAILATVIAGLTIMVLLEN